MVGTSSGITRNTMPTLPCCIKALTRKRPTPGGEMAKLHSLVRSNSATCLSFMTERVSDRVWAAVSGWGDTLVTLPSTLTAGREIGRDEQIAAVATEHQFEQVVDELGGLIAFHVL